MNAKVGAADLITGIRILCAFALLFCQPFSPPFILLYLIAGITDMIDGAVARMTATTSEFGSKLDTAADFVFVAVCLWKLLPRLAVPLWLWVWIVLIALIKMITANPYLSVYNIHFLYNQIQIIKKHLLDIIEASAEPVEELPV